MISAKEFILKSDDWPRWPVLPVVRRVSTDRPDYGLMVAGESKRVYVGLNLFAKGNDFDNAEVKEYETVEALLNEWRID